MKKIGKHLLVALAFAGSLLSTYAKADTCYICKPVQICVFDFCWDWDDCIRLPKCPGTGPGPGA